MSALPTPTPTLPDFYIQLHHIMYKDTIIIIWTLYYNKLLKHHKIEIHMQRLAVKTISALTIQDLPR